MERLVQQAEQRLMEKHKKWVAKEVILMRKESRKQLEAHLKAWAEEHIKTYKPSSQDVAEEIAKG